MSKPADPDVPSDPPPADALVEIDRVARRVHADRGWYVAGATAMALVIPVAYVALASWPERFADWVVPALLVVLAGLGFLAWRGRSVPAAAGQLEARAVYLGAGLATVTLVLNELAIPEGFSVWVVLTSLLPGLPLAYLAWRVARA